VVPCQGSFPESWWGSCQTKLQFAKNKSLHPPLWECHWRQGMEMLKKTPGAVMKTHVVQVGCGIAQMDPFNYTLQRQSREY